MIVNDAELEVVRRQLEHVEAVLESLRKELLPGHERNFNLYAQPWLDFKQQFESDIEAYLARPTPSGNGSPARQDVADAQDLKLT